MAEPVHEQESEAGLSLGWFVGAVLRAIPVASLAVLSVLVLLALASDPPADEDIESPPVGAPLDAPDLVVGSVALRGRLVDERGRGVPDAGLVAAVGPRTLWTWTDTQGGFEFADLPEEAGPELELHVTARGFEVATLVARIGDDGQELALEKRIGPAPELPSLESLDVVGAVQFTPLEDPARGYEVALLPVLALDRPGAGLPRRVAVEADGTFRVEALYPGEYEVLLLPPDSIGRTWPNLLVGSDGRAPRYLHPAPGEGGGDDGRQPATLEIASRAGAIRDRLADTWRAGGARWLEGALVLVEPLDDAGRPDASRVRRAVSDEVGEWMVPHLPPGRYRVRFAAGSERREKTVTVIERATIQVDF